MWTNTCLPIALLLMPVLNAESAVIHHDGVCLVLETPSRRAATFKLEFPTRRGTIAVSIASWHFRIVKRAIAGDRSYRDARQSAATRSR